MNKAWCLFFIFLPLVSAAITPGAISSATAGAGRASVEASDSPFLNPATIPYLKGYFFTSSYNASSNNSSDLTFSITDNMKETILPTSLGYSKSTTQEGDSPQIRTQDLRLAFGERVGNRFGAGLAFHHKSDQTDVISYAQTNMTMASVWSINDQLSAGLVLDDILPVPSDIPDNLRTVTKTSLAIAYNHKRVIRAKVDLITAKNNSFSKPTVLGGVETFMNRWLILRVGAGRDSETSANILSAGMGFQGPKFGIHYAYLQSQNDENFSRHTVDMAIPVW